MVCAACWKLLLLLDVVVAAFVCFRLFCCVDDVACGHYITFAMILFIVVLIVYFCCGLDLNSGWLGGFWFISHVVTGY